MIQRELEAAGLCTVSITLMKGITSKVKVPRAMYVKFPLGRVTGQAFDIEVQTKVVKETLNALSKIETPGQIETLSLE